MEKVASSSGRLARAVMQTTTLLARPAGRTPVWAAWTAPARTWEPARCSRALFGTSAARRADQPPTDRSGALADALGGPAASTAPTPTPTRTPTPTPTSSLSMMEGLADLLPTTRHADAVATGLSTPPRSGSALSALGGVSGLDELDQMKREVGDSMEEYHLTVYSHKHNTHVTVSKPNRDVIVSISSGNLGFKNKNRGTYDAAHQVGAYVCDWLYQRGWHKSIQRLEVSLRGFGQGREAVTKVLLGTEGRLLRHKITRVSDNTHLKFGGSRSQRKRRL